MCPFFTIKTEKNVSFPALNYLQLSRADERNSNLHGWFKQTTNSQGYDLQLEMRMCLLKTPEGLY